MHAHAGRRFSPDFSLLPFGGLKNRQIETVGREQGQEINSVPIFFWCIEGDRKKSPLKSFSDGASSQA